MSGIAYLQQRHPLDADAEREPRVALAVVAAVLEDLRMDHARRRAARSTRCRTRGSPTPSHLKHDTPTSHPGSTNGKYAGPSRTRRRSPNRAFATASSVPFRSANVMPSSTARPST